MGFTFTQKGDRNENGSITSPESRPRHLKLGQELLKKKTTIQTIIYANANKSLYVCNFLLKRLHTPN